MSAADQQEKLHVHLLRSPAWLRAHGLSAPGDLLDIWLPSGRVQEKAKLLGLTDITIGCIFSPDEDPYLSFDDPAGTIAKAGTAEASTIEAETGMKLRTSHFEVSSGHLALGFQRER